MIKFSEYVNDASYDLFVENVDLYLLNPELVESRLDEGLMDFFKDKIQLIKDFAASLSMDVMDLLVAFKDRFIFGFLTKISWSFSKLISIVHDGYTLYTNLHNIIFTYMKEKGITKWTDEKLKELSEYLSSHPNIKRAVGLVVAGFLIYQWTQLIAFTGDIDFDFDQTALFQALSGNYHLMDLFGGESGLKLLSYIAFKLLSGHDIMPWNKVINLTGTAATGTLFMFSIVYTVAKYKYPTVARKMHPMLTHLSKLKS
jgi:hypothetical protein